MIQEVWDYALRHPFIDLTPMTDEQNRLQAWTEGTVKGVGPAQDRNTPHYHVILSVDAMPLRDLTIHHIPDFNGSAFPGRNKNGRRYVWHASVCFKAMGQRVVNPDPRARMDMRLTMDRLMREVGDGAKGRPNHQHWSKEGSLHVWWGLREDEFLIASQGVPEP